MATRGRKPKPTALKLLEGNPGKRQLNMNEPRLTQKIPPECPDWLEEEAQAEWNRLSETLFEMGILTDLDVAPFAAYCQAYARWREAEEFISQHGSIADKKLSSEVGFRGIMRKVIIFLLVGIAQMVDINVIRNGSVLRTAVIFFYLSNEGVSVLENAAHLGLPVPEKLKDVLEQIHDRAEKSE